MYVGRFGRHFGKLQRGAVRTTGRHSQRRMCDSISRSWRTSNLPMLSVSARRSSVSAWSRIMEAGELILVLSHCKSATLYLTPQDAVQIALTNFLSMAEHNPFGIPRVREFLLDPPPALTNQKYAKTYNEVMAIGASTAQSGHRIGLMSRSSTRPPRQPRYSIRPQGRSSRKKGGIRCQRTHGLLR